MEIFRYSSNVYGQSALEGISFELVWLFIGAAGAVIVVHLLYKLLSKARAKSS